MRDAVAAPFVPAASGARVIAFRSASPNGELRPGAGAAALPGPSAPRPLALDLSGSGLVVRVRAALGAALPAASVAAERPVPPAAAAPSTALLERGGLLEAFSTARAASGSDPLAGPSAAAAPPPSPGRERTPSPRRPRPRARRFPRSGGGCSSFRSSPSPRVSSKNAFRRVLTAPG
ncbi:MAG: hypothetical protein M0D55_13925 [Elusimicrobiota bacterium]|nr:MAG: hypothetical protein M0D55_13925 [Elusimicrobiota bacterium]